MALADDLDNEVGAIFQEIWTRRNGRVVPEPKDLGLGNDGVDLTGAVLYADLDGSTNLVDTQTATFAAEIYKTYLLCAAKIIKAEGGVITSYDGDRVMGVFIGDTPCSNATRAALKINWAVHNILRTKFAFYNTTYVLKHAVGVDTSTLMAARIGVRNDNDLVWVGRAANYAAKLTTVNDAAPLFITGDVFDKLVDAVKFGGADKNPMWTQRKWKTMNDMRVYSSTWSWKP